MILDWDDVLARLDSDINLYKELLEIFEVDAPLSINSLKLSVKSGDANAIKGGAHAIKGALRNLGAKSSAAIAEKIEFAGRSGDLRDTELDLEALEVEVNKFLHQAKEIMRNHT